MLERLSKPTARTVKRTISDRTETRANPRFWGVVICFMIRKMDGAGCWESGFKLE
jgi:hypothetical protein